MRALMLDRGRLRLAEAPVPGRPGECLIRVKAAGICGTDLELVKGYAAFSGIPGHEFVGVVERVSRPEDGHWVGRRVVGDINIGCGVCARCRDGLKAHCDNRRVLGIRDRDGAFAEYLTLPSSNLHVVQDSVGDLAAVFVEPIAAACRILEQVSVGAAARVAVMGDGRMGLLIAQVLAAAGAPVRLFCKHADRLALAQSMGLDARRSPDVVQAAGDRFDVVVEATGAADGLTRALALVRPLGTVILKSTVHDPAAMATWPIVVDEITVIGSRCGPFAPALDLLARGAVNVDRLVTCVTGLDDFERAFREAATGVKAVFEIS
jgi:threonine dehydrogenase-like Zn-dependent dehydrogenase